MKCVRIVVYEADTEDEIRRHLVGALLSHQPIVRPGDNVSGIGPIMSGANAPKVTIRLESEKWSDDRDRHLYLTGANETICGKDRKGVLSFHFKRAKKGDCAVCRAMLRELLKTERELPEAVEA